MPCLPVMGEIDTSLIGCMRIDGGLGIVTITDPPTLSADSCMAQLELTFDVTVCETSGTNYVESTTLMAAYYSDMSSLTGTSVAATFPNGIFTLLAEANDVRLLTGFTVTLPAETDNCAAIKFICFTGTFPSDNNDDNDRTCIGLRNNEKVFNCPAFCPELTIEGGNVSNTAVGDGSVVIVTCNEGLELNGMSEVTCNAGTWSDEPTCSAPCDPFTPPNNGALSTDAVAEGTEVTINCDDGYNPTGGNTTRTCTNGEWTGTLPTCIKGAFDGGLGIVTITDPPTLSADSCMAQLELTFDVTVCETSGTNYAESSTLMAAYYSDMSSLTGTSVAATFPNGIFTLLAEANDVRLLTGFTVTLPAETDNCAAIKFICFTGTFPSDINDDNDRTCIGLRNNEKVFNCPAFCPELTIEGGNVSNTAVGDGSVVIVTCNEGLELNGMSEVTCNAGTWSDEPTCSAPCDPFTPPHNGALSTDAVAEGTEVTINCDDGYNPTGGNTTRTCTNGEWTGTLPTCIKGAFDGGLGIVTITDPPTLSADSCMAQLELTFDVTVCETSGTNYAESSTLMAAYYSDMSSLTGTSVAATFPNGIFTLLAEANDVRLLTGFTVTLPAETDNCAAIKFICFTGTFPSDINDDNDRTCIGLRNNEKVFNCPAFCPELTIEGGNVSNTAVGDGSVVIVTCNEGLELNGMSEVTCNAGTWSDEPTCSAPCDPFTPPHNGALSTDAVAEGTEVTINCDDGYNPTGGNTTRTCTNGEWTGTLPTCIKGACWSGSSPISNRRELSALMNKVVEKGREVIILSL
ncbi:sushi, von Willebrand factor type A, EGF and pentraxin domain-containing protein 1-like [Glandiceps talaboti]